MLAKHPQDYSLVSLCTTFVLLLSLGWFPWRSHGRYLLAGEGLEHLRYEVGVGRDHLLPAPSLHHDGHVPGVDELDSLE